MEQFKSGTYINQGYYKSFQPEVSNREWQLNDKILSLKKKK